MTSQILAQSQQEANELGDSSSPSSHASYQPPVGAGPVGAAGGFSRPLAVSLEVGTGIHGLARHIRDGCPESQVGGFEAPLFMEDR